MSFCEECNRATLELCTGNLCLHCCRRIHETHDCDRYDGEWWTKADREAKARDDEDE